MPHDIRLTDDAEEDLEGIVEYISATDSKTRAAYVVAGIRRVVEGLADLPERGPRVRELVEVGRPEYREVLFKPYRIIYRVSGQEVDVYVIADGRRDMRTLLMRRLLSA